MILHEDNNFFGLMIGQLFLILIMPVLHLFDQNISKFIVHMAIIGMMLMTVWGNKENKQWIKFVYILAAIEIILFLIAFSTEAIFLTYIAISLSLFFLISSIAMALHSVFLSEEINANQLVGASCIYLLLGIVWSILYSNLYYFYPDSFSGLTSNNTLHISEFMYYSYVTLTTLGFGDITPLSPGAKTLSYLQAVTGQLYLTIMVAGLVGKAITHKNKA